MAETSLQLQVLICTLGEAGMKRVLESKHPQVEGVGYLVAWQQPDEVLQVPGELAVREDFRVVVSHDRGLSRNRNFAIEQATAPFCLISDDDVDYYADALRELVALFEAQSDLAVVALRYLSGGKYVKIYPEGVRSLGHMPKGYYPTSFELAFRRLPVLTTGVRFNEYLGIGAPLFGAGEEDVWLYDLRHHGLRSEFHPITIGEHNRATTGERCGLDDWFIMTHGAVIRHIRPWLWWAALPVHAMRSALKGERGFLAYMRLCLRGVGYARRHKIFMK